MTDAGKKLNIEFINIGQWETQIESSRRRQLEGERKLWGEESSSTDLRKSRVSSKNAVSNVSRELKNENPRESVNNSAHESRGWKDKFIIGAKS